MSVSQDQTDSEGDREAFLKLIKEFVELAEQLPPDERDHAFAMLRAQMGDKSAPCHRVYATVYKTLDRLIASWNDAIVDVARRDLAVFRGILALELLIEVDATVRAIEAVKPVDAGELSSPDKVWAGLLDQLKTSGSDLDTSIGAIELAGSVAAIMQLQATMDAIMTDVYGVTALALELGAKGADPWESLGGMSLSDFTKATGVAQERVEGFLRLPYGRRITALAGLTGVDWPRNRELERALNHHRGIRNELAHGERTSYLPGKSGAAAVVGDSFSSRRVRVGRNHAVGLQSVAISAFLETVGILEAALGIAVLTQQERDAWVQNADDGRAFWLLDPVRSRD